MSSNPADILAQLGLERTLDELRERDLQELQDADMPAGLPRPRLRVPGYENGPTPYVAASPSSPGTLDFARTVASDKGFLCAVCGLKVTDARCGIATGAPADGADPDLLTVDGDHGLSHETCARMTTAWCPAFTGRPDLPPLLMWFVDTAALRAVWHRLDTDLTLGLLGSRELVPAPPAAHRPWMAS